MAEAQGVNVEIADDRGLVTMTLRTPGVGSVPISLDPNAAWELSEKLGVAAHNAQTGSSVILLPETTAHKIDRKRPMLIRRIEVMLNSLRTSTKTNAEIAQEVVDRVLDKVA